MAQQQQYIQFAPQPAGSYPGATVYAYPGNQPVQVVQLQPRVSNTATVLNKYNQDGERAAIVLGIIQFIIGCACICFQSASSSLETRLGRDIYSATAYTSEFIGTGIWCGILFLVTGILGICSSKKNTPGLIIAFMVMNIISSLAIWTLLSFAASNLNWIRRCQDGDTIIWSRMSDISAMSCTDKLYSVWAAMDGLMVALALIEFIVAVTSSAYCCKAVCFCCRSNTGMIIQQPATGVYLPTTTMQQQVLQQQHMLMQQQSPATGTPYPIQGMPYGQYGGGAPAAPAYPQAAAAPAQYPQGPYNPYGNVTAPQPYATQSAQQLPGAAYAVTGGYPQAAGVGVATTVAYPRDQSMSHAQPPYPAVPSAPEAQSATNDVKAPLLPPDYNTAVKL